MLTFSAVLTALAVAVAAVPAHPFPVERDVEVLKRGTDGLLHQRGFNIAGGRGPIDYTQNNSTGGTVVFSPSKTGFSVQWSKTEDFLVGVGWKTGSTTPLTFDGSLSVENGTGFVSVYGWTTDPLVEYFIIENNANLTPLGTVKGNFTSDGSEYTVIERLYYSEVPSPKSIWWEYYSVRTSPRTSGTVTIENHFQAWASMGMKTGTLNYQLLAVLGWGGSGSALQYVVEDTAVPEANAE